MSKVGYNPFIITNNRMNIFWNKKLNFILLMLQLSPKVIRHEIDV